jgi:hypothetical protein
VHMASMVIVASTTLIMDTLTCFRYSPQESLV